MAKEKMKNVVENNTINASIQANNKVVTKMLTVFVCFTLVMFLLSSMCASYIRELAESAAEVEKGRNYLNQWVLDVETSIAEGTPLTCETSADKCEFALAP